MVHSMTAFARVEKAGPQGTLSWELRSVNSRYLEPHLRLPESFRDLEGFDKGLEEASNDLGESAWMTFWRVTFPIALPGIVASLLMCFTISFDEFVMAFFLSGTDQTLPVFLYSQLRFPNKLPPTLSLGSTILAASIVIVIVSEWLRRRGVQTSKPGAF